MTPSERSDPGLQPFTYELSAGNWSFTRVDSLRSVRPKASGLAGPTFIPPIMRSSIGGGGVVVAQNAFDIAADRGFSSFDQRHKFRELDLRFALRREPAICAEGRGLAHLYGWQWTGILLSRAACRIPFECWEDAGHSTRSRGSRHTWFLANRPRQQSHQQGVVQHRGVLPAGDDGKQPGPRRA